MEKILIANRGEIASRIIRTCKRMQIPCAAVYSEADSGAPYTSEADEAYLIGGPRVADSYLNIEKIIRTAKESGCTMVHPGYGFLSENSMFARRCREEGLRFIGPDPEVIDMMGSKVEARRTMEAAGLTLVPGLSRPLADEEDALTQADAIGYPVMLKASAGGGGIGMQAVSSTEEMKKAFAGNQKRAAMFFGNGDMFIEKLVEEPRHIEVQVMADHHGCTAALWERECSIQRRHQKVFEEAPSAFLNEEDRERICTAAVKAAKAISYTNAGTFEFLMDRHKNFYFLEMNTRLQVEHPVTEEITGLDLVELQIRAARGEALGLIQEQIKKEGHAIEVRIYAEDPKTFYPSPGRITLLDIPEADYIRHELGVEGCSVVTPHYDPMIAKMIVTGRTRAEAAERLTKALEDYRVEGIKTNLPLLLEVSRHEAYRRGDTTTDFIKQYIEGKDRANA